MKLTEDQKKLIQRDGTVLNVYTGKPRKKDFNQQGTPVIKMTIGDKSRKVSVMKLVALAHLPNPEGHTIVIPKDGNNKNCHVDNLKWVSSADFMKATALTYTVHGEEHVQAKLTEDDVRFIRSSFFTDTQLARNLNVSRSAISCARNRISWKHVK
ncbi:MAG: hypothetical protein ACRDCE_17940 [Cetobacterium sp.]|uniref:hypothetical protein n=1 Tax=Cetobacterium sp. TaxID=2071632 RepID=UPI003EE6ECF5